MFGSLLSVLLNFLLQILYKAAWKPWWLEQIPRSTAKNLLSFAQVLGDAC